MIFDFPNINPIILPLGPLAISWYSLSYVFGVIIGSMYCKYLIRQHNIKITPLQFDDFISYLIIGIIVGGRLAYVLFYDPVRYFNDPIQILKTYEGGMSFHGGLIGVILSALLFACLNKISFIALADLLASAAPIGIALGRLANFINCELVGRVTTFPIAVLFPPDFLPRHPSQIYESLTEGVLNFIILAWMIRKYNTLKTPGAVSGLFLLIYGICRISCEFLRQPDQQIGFILGYITMGQILSLPFIVIGIAILTWSYSRK